MRFFFYGTLMAESGNAAARLHSRLRPLGTGVTRGRLYALADPHGWYPVLVPGRGEVRGMIYEAMYGFARQDLAAMDAYEDCDPARPLQSLYLRKPVPVRAGGQSGGEAYAYIYNLPLMRGALRIGGGNFARWLERRGGKAFAGS